MTDVPSDPAARAKSLVVWAWTVPLVMAPAGLVMATLGFMVLYPPAPTVQVLVGWSMMVVGGLAVPLAPVAGVILGVMAVGEAPKGARGVVGTAVVAIILCVAVPFFMFWSCR